MNTIVNGTPLTRTQGVNDESIEPPVYQPVSVPTHLAKIYIFAADGPAGGQMTVGASRTRMYGAESFDLRQKWANHATVLANTINETGNIAMTERVFPADIGPRANLRLMLDVLKTKVPEYKRNEDGSYQRDETGKPIPTGTFIDGAHSVKWVTEYIAPDVDGNSQFGLGTIKAGDQVDEASGTQSKRYPIQDLEVSHLGSKGNNLGYRIWAPTSKSSSPLDERLITTDRVYPFRVQVVQRETVDSTASVVDSIADGPFFDVCWKPNTLNRRNDSLMYIGDRFIKAYQDLHPADGTPPLFGPFGRLHTYDDNVKLLVEEFYQAEKPFIDLFSDFTGEDDEAYRFNFIGGVTSKNTPYHSFVMANTAANAVRLTENTHVYATGGSDGTMNDTTFAAAVSKAVKAYGDQNSPLQDTAKYPESILYDSGFPLETKYDLCNFISIRKDTLVVLSTHDVLGKSLTASEDSSMAVALRTRAMMYPESDNFNTPTCRALVVGRSGRLLNSQYNKRLPLTIEVAEKAARYMGAANGVWNSDYAFDSAPGNLVNRFAEVNVTFTPVSVRNRDWDNGMIWVDNFDTRSLYFPAFKTVYPNDSSILTSFFTVMAVVELEKVGMRAHRQFSGNSSLTRAQLVERVNRFVEENTVGRFGDRFVIRPRCYFTSQDIQRGYSWTLEIVILGPNMRTVQTLYITARNRDNQDAAAQAAA